MRLPLIVFIASLAFAAAARADGDAAAGLKVYTTKCKICHSVDASGKNGVGPGLNGVFGRTAGTKEGFAYSPAMKAMGTVWSADTIKAYVANPKDSVPGNKMAFVGIKNPDELENLMAYLKEVTK
ncbi:hypothetical protein VZ95_04710 [Elstera litoralis]|uniref:Cytochrome c domain-containing protein n=1 Tax=Elstera litoralis TaxID=552518 RepID=A0A0F3IUS7_9PROT|nr:cytochrome c family protein [Elstera litoralis]KJV10461.1 hypothetical protein VZ95_04710 [Elstera litoralis]